MYIALLLLVLGFGLDAASAFTTAYSRRWGKSRGALLSFVLRNVLGIPLWVLGLGVAVRVPSPPLFAASTLSLALGWLLLGAGATIQTLAIVVIGMRAARPSVDDELAAQGVYAYIRHPVYAGLLLEFAGTVFVQPRRIVLAAAALGSAWVWLQARLEERDLVERMPAYVEYMNRVPRFVPRRARKGRT
jgi:protein-S-isoprenylcysteine O-methyltransferase Ste14